MTVVLTGGHADGRTITTPTGGAVLLVPWVDETGYGSDFYTSDGTFIRSQRGASHARVWNDNYRDLIRYLWGDD